MYGLIHMAIESYVRSRHGDAVWSRVLDAAGSPSSAFVSMEAYPDEVTLKLVGATCGTLGVDVPTALREVGKCWTVFVAEKGYGHLLDASGNTLPELLRNLDQLHARINLIFPDLRTPGFSVTDERPGELVLHYFSERAGLGSMVVGLIEGLATRFNVTVDVTPFDCETPKPHAAFKVRWTPVAA